MSKVILSLTAPLTPSILNGIQLNETINKNNLELLKNYSKLDEPTKKQLLTLSKNLNKSNILQVKYSNPDGIGRNFCSLGSSSFSRMIRHTLYTYYTDIDIVNSGYTILKNICEHNNIICKYIKNYINNRDGILTTISENGKCTKEQIKNFF